MKTLKIFAVLNLLIVVYSGSVEQKNERELIYLQILSTNGIFTPLELYPNNKNLENAWPDGLGALTKLGKSQQYALGKLLRRTYRHFITSSPVEVDVFSSAEDRSILSVECLMASLYEPTPEWEFVPGFNWQPIPVTYLDTDDIFFRYPEDCITQIREKEILYNNSPGRDFIQKDKFLYSFWTNHSGTEIRNWNDVAKLYDTLEKEKTFGYRVPRWAEKHWFDLKRIADSAYVWNYQSLRNLQLKVGPLVDFMTSRMRVKTIEKNSGKVSVYMTHDWNLAAFLTTLKLHNGLRPPPCATVTIEMYRENEEEFSVRMHFYNSTQPELGYQKPHLLKLPHCAEFCPLYTFVDNFMRYIPPDFFELCKNIVS